MAPSAWRLACASSWEHHHGAKNLSGPWLQQMRRQKCNAQHNATKAKTNAKANAKPPPAA
eukprot:3503332-Prorocentrum_lima.AAC.1